MSLKLSAPVVVLLLFSWTAARGKDAEVACVQKQSCVLPCRFQTGPDILIHWYKEPGDKTIVHSFYHNQSQFSHQHKNYTNRTSLCEEKIHSGDASLQLRNIRLRDEGKYKCYISTKGKPEEYNTEEYFINLQVHAPVSLVSLEQKEEQLVCRSENIYPRPKVTWTFSSEPLDPQTSTQSSETGLFSVSSSVYLLRAPQEYICNISTELSWRSATYRRNLPINSAAAEAILLCAPGASSPKNLRSVSWTFNWTHSIVNQTGPEPVYSGSWGRFVKILDSGDLRLKKELSTEHSGVYSCDLRTDSGTYLSVTELQTTERRTGDHTIWTIVGGVILGLICLFIVALGIWKIQESCSRQRTGRNEVVEQHEIRALQNPDPAEGEQG